MILNKLINYRINKDDWRIVDFRIDIPAKGRGSDAINPHTQYSNAIAELNDNGEVYFGAGFTLGLGNDLLCRAIDELLTLWDGKTILEISVEANISPYSVMQNPLQLRWLSPNSGVVYQAVGIIANTILEKYSRDNNSPLWVDLAKITQNEFLKFYGELNNLDQSSSLSDCFTSSQSFKESSNIYAYHTTWIGSKAEELVDEMKSINDIKGISLFKLKIGNDVEFFLDRIDRIISLIPNGFSICVDANQTLTFDNAIEYMRELSARNILWLEEPFAPDNILLFEKLCSQKNKENWSTEIVTGENCPSPHIAQALISTGIDRFQADPCRMMGMVDIPLIVSLCKKHDCTLTPHAGGSLLDEMSSHISCFISAMGREDDKYLIENVGFCNQFLENPSRIVGGKLVKPFHSGFIGDFKPSIKEKFKSYKEGITWVTL